MRSLRSIGVAVFVCAFLGCGAQTSGEQTARAETNGANDASPNAAAPAPAERKQQPKPSSKTDDPLFPKRKARGWKQLSANERVFAASIAGDYIEFLNTGRTPRRALSRLIALAEDGGARATDGTERGLTGYHFIREPDGGAAVFFRSGSRPATRGLAVIVVSVDAPRLILKQTPVQRRNAMEVLQTLQHGELDLPSWMVHPIALDVYAMKRGKPIAFSIGDKDGDPVLSIPDLLPHLSRGSQKRGAKEIDPERLDLLGAIRPGALARVLAARGLSVSDLSSAEANVVPASSARLIGVDRGLVGGYGQANRSLAFAAVRALGESKPTLGAIVVVITRSDDGGKGSSGYAYVSRALRSAVAALSPIDVDNYDTQVVLSRSAALVAEPHTGKPNGGLIVNISSADALPAPTRILTKALETASVPFSIRDKKGGRIARTLASLDLDAITISIPTTSAGAPGATISALDLYHGVLACSAWLSRSP